MEASAATLTPTVTPAADLSRLKFDKHHAFIIGLDDYRHVSKLRTAVSDAQRLAEVLSAQHHFTVHEPLLDATGEQIRELLTSTMVPPRIGANDRVLLYFAGHGIADDGEGGPAGYLVPVDAEPGRIETFIPMADLQAALDALPCRHLLLILDCCFSGAFKWSSRHRAIGTMMPKRIYDKRFDRFAADPARQIITSAAHDQKALDVLAGKATGARGALHSGDDGRAHSPFALALFEGLAGEADVKGERGSDGVLTATELYCYIRDQIEPATLEQGQRMRQTPAFFPLAGHGQGEFMFLHPRHRLNLPPQPERSPYKGLASFDERDHDLFYGRGRVIDELRRRAEDPASRLLVVAGASGTGKSSVIKAGLLPVLRDAGHRILEVMRPGVHPLAELERVLKEAAAPAGGTDGRDARNGSDGRDGRDGKDSVPATPARAAGAVLMIDQFEEVITRCASATERAAFDARLRQLLDDDDGASPVARLIITVRSDFEPQLNGGALKEAWQRGRCTVPPFSLEELREVVEMPAIQEVLVFEPPALVDEIIEEVVQSPGALPLLSYALSELFEACKHGRELKKDAYDKLGGVMGALRTKADSLHQNLQVAEQEAMRKIMLRMVSVEGETAGRRVPIADLDFGNTALVDKVIERLVTARLIVQGRSDEGLQYVEPAHDALVRAWKLLQDWIHQAGKDNLIRGARLALAADDFERTHDPEYLWHDNPNLPLVQKELKSERGSAFNAKEAAFIRRSVRRKTRRAWTIRGVTVAVMASLGGLAGWAWRENWRAASAVTEARGFTDKLLDELVNELRALPNTEEVQRSLLDKVKGLEITLDSVVGVKEDLTTDFYRSLLEGDLERNDGKHEAARSKYEEALRIAQQMSQTPVRQPILGFDAARRIYARFMGIEQVHDAQAFWQRHLSTIYSRLADLESRLGSERVHVVRARDWYEMALVIDERLAQGIPGKQAPHDLWLTYDNLGRLLFAHGNLLRQRARELDRHAAAHSLAEADQMYNDARVAYSKARQVAERMAAGPDADARARRTWSLSLVHLGDLYYELALPQLDGPEAEQARELYAQALGLAQRWPAELLLDKEHRSALCPAWDLLTDLQQRNGRWDDARESAVKALKLIAEQAADAAGPEDACAARKFAFLMHLGRIEAGAGRTEAARAALELAKEHAKLALSKGREQVASARKQERARHAELGRQEQEALNELAALPRKRRR